MGKAFVNGAILLAVIAGGVYAGLMIYSRYSGGGSIDNG